MSHAPWTNRLPPEEIFAYALGLGPGDRQAFLNRACGKNPELLRQIEELLAFADRNPEVLQNPYDPPLPDKLKNFEILSLCGKGGMGHVYRARDRKLGRLVALKVLRQPLARDRIWRDRFLTEARALASLQDHRIASIYDADEADGFHFLIMEFVEGKTLAEILESGPLPLAKTLHYGNQLAQAIASAHEKNIVHRDIKPANIMITAEDGIKVLDFGIAKILEQGQEAVNRAFRYGAGATGGIGTPGYMSPEQLLGGRVDHRSDLWALGCILYECLTGKRPASATSTQSDAGEFSMAGNLGSMPSGTPRQLKDLIARCLEVDPEKRLSSAAEVGRNLESLTNRTALRRKFGWYSLVLVPLLALATLRLFFPGSTTTSLATIEASKDSIVRALSDNGELLWKKNVHCLVRNNHAIMNSRQRHTIVRLRGEPAGVVISTKCGELLYLAAGDGALIWRHAAGWTAPRNAKARPQFWWSRDFLWPGTDTPIIAAAIRDGMWYGFALEFITLNNKTLGIYHHPGQLNFSSVVDLDGDGNPSLILYGLNSSARFDSTLAPFTTRAHPGCVVLLDDITSTGQAYPYSEGMPQERDWPDLRRAREQAYLLVSLVHPNVHAEVTSVRIYDEPDDQKSLLIVTADGRYIRLNSQLFPMSCYVTMGSLADSLHTLGQLPSQTFLLIRDGELEYVDVVPEF